jgi:uncharacterized protein YneF (UPF0154 family)
MNKSLLVIIPLVVCGGAGLAAGYFFGDAGMRDEYMRNYGMAGGMAGLVIGVLLAQRAAKKALKEAADRSRPHS